MTNKHNKRGVNRRASQRKSPDKINMIPVFQPDVPQSIVYRYAIEDSAGENVEFARELPIYPYAVAETATTLLVPFKSVRIARIRMWCSYRPTQSIVNNTISLTQVTRRGVRPIEWQDTASTSGDALIDKSFDKNEPSGLWYITASGETNPEFTFRFPKGGVLEITYVYILSDGEGLGTEAGTSLNFPRVYSNKLHTDLLVLGKATTSSAVF